MKKQYLQPKSENLLLCSHNALCQPIGQSGGDPEDDGRAPRREPVVD